MQQRRTVLAALGMSVAALAGCVGDSDDNQQSDGNATGTGSNDGNVTWEDDSASGTNSAAITVAGQFEAEPDRPDCTVESETIEIARGDETETHETAATVPYPDPPTNFEDPIEFVESYEGAYVRKNILCGRTGSSEILRITYDVQQAETFPWYEDGPAIVFLLRAGAATRGTDGEGGPIWVADIAYSGVVYAVDETGVARAEFDEAASLDKEEFETSAPDPLETGTLLESF